MKLKAGAMFMSAALVPVPPVFAAEEPALEEVVVTARKREEDLQKVPMSVTAFSSDQIESAKIASITDLERLTPNVTVADTGGLVAGAVAVFMRGIGNDPGYDQGIGIYIDDVYLNRTTGGLLETYDIERIEVLKGPQGHLYGRNTIGGAIKYVTRRPGDEFEADVQAKAGRFNLLQFKGSVSGPLIADRLYGGFGAIVREQDGIQKNQFDGREFWGSDFKAFRANLLGNITDDLSAYLTLDYSMDDSAPRVPNRVAVNATSLAGVDFVISGANRYLGPGTGLVSTPNDASLPTDIDVVNTDYGAAFNEFEIETTTAALTLEWDINDQWRLKSVSAGRLMDNVQVYDFDSSPQQFITTLLPRESDDYSQELQLNFAGDSLNAVVGLYYLDATQQSLTTNPQYPRLRAVQTFLRTALDNEETLESTSAYASVDWDFADAWQLSLGGRYTKDKKTTFQYERLDEGLFALAWLRGFPLSATVAVAPGQEATAAASPMFAGWVPGRSQYFERTTFNRLQGEGEWSEFTPSAKLSWSPTGDTLLYAGYASGFKTGGFNTFSSAVHTFDPETVDSYTLGFKGTFAGQFRLNAELFYNDYQDKQLTTITLINNVLTSLQSNVGAMTTQGGEVEMTWATPVEGLTLGLNFGYLDTEVDSYLTTVDHDSNPATPPQVVDIAPYTAIGYAPEWTAQARAQYEFDLGNVGRLTLDADVSHREESYTNSPIDLRETWALVQVQEAHEMYNASLTWRSLDDKWRVALEGRNLSDERVLTSTYKVAQFITGGYTMPRTWAVSVGYSFD